MTSVVSRIGIGQYQQRQEHGGDGRSRRRPAGGEPECGEHEPEHLAARVTHEHGRAAARTQVERQEAEAGKAEREREHEHDVVLVRGRRVDREVATGDGGERRGEPVHVVEQVERVRDPDEPHERDDGRDHVVRDQLDAEAGGHGDTRGRELCPELGERAQVPDVVDEPGREEDRTTGEDAEAAPRRRSPRRPRPRSRRLRRGRG